ncbi:MAG: starch-binding protein [Muribaculaceae bacterium]|nr:starch-binding protein [Muribaculaceae bacterium]
MIRRLIGLSVMMILTVLSVFAQDSATEDVYYYKNSGNWGAVYAHAWKKVNGTDTPIFGDWPGRECTKVTIDGQYLYRIVIPKSDNIVGLIFNNKGQGSQTGDIEGTNLKSGYIYDYTSAEPIARVSNGKIVGVNDPDPEPEPNPETHNYYYFNNSTTNWSNVYAYAWGGGNTIILGAWPGTQLNEITIDNHKVYRVAISKTQTLDGLIFHQKDAGNNTTGDIIGGNLSPGYVYGGDGANYIATISNGKYRDKNDPNPDEPAPENPDPMPEAKDGYNLVFFNTAGSNITAPCFYIFDTNNEAAKDWADSPAMEGPIWIKVRESEDSDNYINTKVYYAYVDQQYDFVIFKQEGDVKNSDVNMQTKDLFVVPNGYYTFSQRSRSAPIYAVSNSMTVYNHVPTPLPYTLFVTYNGLTAGQNMTVVECKGVKGGIYSGNGNIPMTYVEFDGKGYYKWTTASLYKVSEVYITFKRGDGREWNFSSGNSDPWKQVSIKDDLIINLDNPANSTVMPPITDLTPVFGGGVKARANEEDVNDTLTMIYDQDTEDYIAVITTDTAKSNPGVFWLEVGGKRYGVEDPANNGFQNGVWNELVEGNDETMQFSNRKRSYKMVYDPRGQILVAEWIANNSNLSLWAEGKQQNDTFSIDAVRGNTTGQPTVKMYIKGSRAFDQAVDDVAQVFNLDNVKVTLEPRFDTDRMISSQSGENIYLSPSAAEITHIEDEDSSVAGELILSIDEIPVPGLYNLEVTYVGDDDFNPSTANITLEARPTIETVGLAIATNAWQNKSEVKEENGAYTVDLVVNSTSRLPLYFYSTYGYGAPYLQIYNTLSGWGKTRSVDPELKEYTYPIPYDTYAEVPSFNYQLTMNGAEGPKGTVTIGNRDIQTEVEDISDDTETTETVYFNLNGLRVEKENLTPGVYVEVRAGENRKVVIK